MATWQLEEGGTLGDGADYTPVQYPRSDADRSGGVDGEVADPAAHESESGETATSDNQTETGGVDNGM